MMIFLTREEEENNEIRHQTIQNFVKRIIDGHSFIYLYEIQSLIFEFFGIWSLSISKVIAKEIKSKRRKMCPIYEEENHQNKIFGINFTHKNSIIFC